uniref:Uncharacterized protein n=1 Tax=Oryza barthii TaxID=65489 RepID=A0A0D3H6M3_9ORYZ
MARHDHINLILSPAAAVARCRPPPLLASTSTSSTGSLSWCAIVSYRWWSWSSRGTLLLPCEVKREEGSVVGGKEVV